ncbi:MAG: hypothetical protein LIP16_15050 [Clostridium sp.]|nr:hypothetical protein [Clostridium sp.]
MKKYKKIIVTAIAVAALLCLFSTQAFAISESDVQAAVDSSSKETVSGNVFIWFLCAIAFLKVSQKIDSFMSSLGINVGHTGGSMIAEAMIAARGISAVKGFSGGGFRGGGSSGSRSSSGGASAAASFMSGGLAGAVGRQFANGAVKNATGVSSGGIGGRMFTSSVGKGGDFANNVIGTVARGSISAVGSMTGESASQGLLSYMGYTGMEAGDAPAFSDVEIGGGRIMGTETTAEHPNGIAFGMYHADQYTAPEGEFSTVTAVDGSKWYKQYATDAVEKSPYMAPDGSIAYNESIIKKLPQAPRRKDKI